MKYTATNSKFNSKKMTVPRLSVMKSDAKFERGEIKKAYNVECRDGKIITRQRRAAVRSLTSADGLHGDDTLAYVDSGKLYYGGIEIIGLMLTLGEKQIHKLDKYLLVFPDGVFVNLENTADFGNLSAYTTSGGAVAYLLNESYAKIDYTLVTELPSEGVKDEYCVLKDDEGGLSAMKYDGNAWVQVKTFIRIQSSGIGAPFRVGNFISSTGLDKIGLKSFYVRYKSNDIIITDGIIGANTNLGRVTFKRYIPEFDFVTVSGNRLVGVRRGEDENGVYVCKMYASAENSPFNFTAESGGCELSLNICGAFTGVCDYLGAPVAFTESEIIEGRYKNGALIASVIKGYGVERGASKSMACLNGKLYYKSGVGVCEYDGSYPECISGDIGDVFVGSNGCPAGVAKGKYYIKLTDINSQNSIYVYNVSDKSWTVQDDPRAVYFACRGGELYMMCEGGELVLVDAEGLSDERRDYLSDGGAVPEDDVLWSVESADIGAESFDSVHPTRLLLRIHKPEGKRLSVGVLYDGAELPENVISTDAGFGGAACLPIPLRRCDTFSFKVSGEGECKLLGYEARVREGGAVNGWK